ncbi:MAG: hypothetical protein Q7J84_18995 [Sulfuricaulis sp.]|nr:hypothetical protein [Sulfuricaulis sp.]
MLGWKAFGAGLSLPLSEAICKDVATALSAAGTTQGTATELGAACSEVTTVAAGAGVVLSASLAAGDEQSVFNAGANAVKVYPPSGFKINALAANAPMTLATNTGVIFKCVSTTRVFGVLSA